MYGEILVGLRESYASKVEERDNQQVSPWKEQQRAEFLSLLKKEDKRTLLDIGAGTGVHGEFFRDRGLDVTCTDLSPAMIERCREKGLTAHVMDFLNLEFPAEFFEAVFAMNCLLHVPKQDLPRVLEVIRNIMTSGGLFYWASMGAYHQGIWAKDHYEPKRFFSLLPDDQIQRFAVQHFRMVSFNRVELEGDSDHFQSMVLRRSNLREDARS